MPQQTTRRWDLPLIEQGRAEGRAEGEARVVKRQLRLKFGELPASIEEHVSQASTDQLETWADRVLIARSLAEVFAD